MERSRYLAGLIGPTMIALAGMVLFNRSTLPAMLEAPDSALVIIVSGAITFVAGLAILHAHGVWRGWPLIITLVGVMGVVGGLARLWAPGLVVAGAQCALAYPAALPIAAAVMAALGLFLTWQAYRPRVPESPR
jgi:hypothetical protein